jgi:L-2-hydroxyglutarate oxidase LhgO
MTKKGVLKSAQSLVDEVQPHWLETTPKVGIRPQLINIEKNKLEMDFLMRKGSNSLHILNSISPAFTSSFAVAEHIVDNLNL